MKKLMPFIGFAVLVLFSCSKEKADVFSFQNHLIDLSTGKTINEELPANFEITQTPGDLVRTRSNNNNSHYNGHFTTPNGNTFSGSVHQNNGGTNGQIHVNDLWEFHIDGSCIIAEGNAAVVGGMITQVTNNGGIPELAVGNYYYMKVFDNGEGNNAPSDQFARLAWVEETDWCDNLTIDYILDADGNIVTPWDFFGISDTANESDQIQVND